MRLFFAFMIGVGALVGTIAVTRKISAQEPEDELEDELDVELDDELDDELTGLIDPGIATPSSPLSNSPSRQLGFDRKPGASSTRSKLRAWYQVSAATVDALISLANQVGTSPTTLAAIIHYQTDGTWRADARNGRGGFGLLGWAPTMVPVLNMSSSTLLNLDVRAQLLGPVHAYLQAGRQGRLWDLSPYSGNPLRRYPARALSSAHTLAMTIVFPAYREDEDVDARFPLNVQNQLGVSTPREYLAAVVNALPAGASL